MSKAKSMLTTIGSLAATIMVARTIINDFIPYEITNYLSSTVRSFIYGGFASNLVLTINEFDGLDANQIFEAAKLHLSTLAKSSVAQSLCVMKTESEKSIHVAVDQDQDIVDCFEGVKFTWVLHCEQVEMNSNSNSNSNHNTIRKFHLTFHKRHKQLALEKYLPYILNQSSVLKQESKALKLFTIDYNSWESVNLNHPATFDTLAMDPQKKTMIIDDLDRFLKRKEYYRRVGKAWKRGYLLYGPPGTGKSSLIAAIANYINFDIYDLDLTQLEYDSELKKLLLGIGNQSIIVMEDVDCSLQFQNREAVNDNNSEDGHNRRHVTLSGFLNFIDGLWSNCGDERIIIFTTNYKERLDPALLRPGRMDMHILMSYCTPPGFRVLAKNYLGLEDHEMFEEIEGLIRDCQVTPAEVAEQLIKHDDSSVALRGLLDFVEAKNMSNTSVLLKDGDNGGSTLKKDLADTAEVDCIQRFGEEENERDILSHYPCNELFH